jgi:cysteinyl-tRNA synthetase
MCSDKQRKRKQSKCGSTRWNKEETEEAILREIRRELTSPNLAEHLFKLYKERNKKQSSQKETILQEIQALTDRINRLLDMVESGSAI